MFVTYYITNRIWDLLAENKQSDSGKGVCGINVSGESWRVNI